MPVFFRITGIVFGSMPKDLEYRHPGQGFEIIVGPGIVGIVVKSIL